MTVVIVPCLRDNYAYLVVGDEPGVAIVVDPSEDKPIREALAKAGLTLGGILLTHHHVDHTGGVPGLLADHPGLPVIAGVVEEPKIAGVTRALADGETFQIRGLEFEVLHIPGHTLGAVAFVLREQGKSVAAFSGDTLFGAGCGRLFEGTPAMMHHSLSTVLGALPGSVEVYPGHEYTASNLEFAAHVEPDNAKIGERAGRVAFLREKGAPSVPSTMAEERETNPFLRVHSPAVRSFAGASPDTPDDTVFAAVRKAKDEL